MKQFGAEVCQLGEEEKQDFGTGLPLLLVAFRLLQIRRRIG